MQQNNDLVSIIMPAYNSEQYIAGSIESVLQQTYSNWECIIVDDCSTDGTATGVLRFSDVDKRITLHKNDKNMGAAVTRNRAVELAKGKYIAFLDSDDTWVKEKLAVQIEFMRQNGASFSCTSYGKIDKYGNVLSEQRHPKSKATYWDVIRSSPGNSTVIYDAGVLGKFFTPDIRKRNDYVMWLKVIKSAGELHGLDNVLAYHRLRPDSLSSNKFSLVKYHWKVYREFEKLPVITSLYLIAYHIIKSVLKLH